MLTDFLDNEALKVVVNDLEDINALTLGIEVDQARL